MIKRTASVLAASLMTALLAAPASAGTMRLGILTCDIEGGTALVIASHKGLDCTFKPSGGGHKERYTGIISKIGVDLGVTHQGSLVWAVLAVTSDYEGRRQPARRRLPAIVQPAAAERPGADRRQSRAGRDVDEAIPAAEIARLPALPAGRDGTLKPRRQLLTKVLKEVPT